MAKIAINHGSNEFKLVSSLNCLSIYIIGEEQYIFLGHPGFVAEGPTAKGKLTRGKYTNVFDVIFK